MASEWHVPSGFVTAVIMYLVASAFTGVWFVASLSTRVTTLETDQVASQANTKLLHDIDTRTKVMEEIMRQQGRGPHDQTISIP